MNSDIHSISLRAEAASALRQALRKGLPAEIHLIVTSGMTPEAKTDKLEALAYDFHVLEGVLAWTPQDEGTGRALRQLNTEGVMRLREIAVSAVPDGEQPHPDLVGAITVITRALAAPLDAARLVFPIGDMEHPRVRA
jgi:hypothetical protein